MTLRSFAELAAKIAIANESVKVAAEVSLAETAALIADVAKDAIGTYEFGWQPLAAGTIARKGADTPLLETGRLRDSIGWTLESAEVAYVGTNDPNAKYHEFGTSKIPPRPFLLGALLATEGHIVKIFGKNIKRAMMGGSAELRELRHALHLLKEAWHAVKEAAESFENEEKHRR